MQAVTVGDCDAFAVSEPCDLGMVLLGPFEGRMRLAEDVVGGGGVGGVVRFEQPSRQLLEVLGAVGEVGAE